MTAQREFSSGAWTATRSAGLLTEVDAETFDRAFADEVMACGVSEGALALGREITRLGANGDPQDDRALLLLVGAVLAAEARGDTRLALDLGPETLLGGLARRIGLRLDSESGAPSAPSGMEEERNRVTGGEAGGALARRATEGVVLDLWPAVIGATAEAFRPLVGGRRFLATHRLVCLEAAIARRVETLAASTHAPATDIATILAELRNTPPRAGARALVLTDEQEAAVREAASGARLVLISGGPGTGKTAIAVAILRALVRTGVDPARIALAAPTGRAAFRLTGSVQSALTSLDAPAPADCALLQALRPAETLHRLLGYVEPSGRFRHHAQAPLGFDVVVIDEASMVDLAMLDRVLAALPKGARLILQGDADQLPSVEAGAGFRDLLAAARSGVASMRLGRSFRMDQDDADGRALLLTAARVHKGLPLTLPDADGASVVHRRRTITRLRFRGVESWAPAEAGLEPLLGRWWDEQLAPVAQLATKAVRMEAGDLVASDVAHVEAIFAAASRGRILTVTHGGRCGADAVNRALHKRRASSERAPIAAHYLPGEPIVVTKNAYDLGLMNGDQGVCLRVAQDGRAPRRCAVFAGPEGYVAYPLEALDGRLDLAYALTVHRAQGSEFDAIVIVLPEVDTPILDRSLLYTAITRSRRSVVLVGSTAAIRRAAARSASRNTSLAERLRSV